MSEYTLSNFRGLIAKNNQEIAQLNFEEGDVLFLAEDIRVRKTNIDKANALGKSTKYKTAIIIKTQEGLSKIESPVIGHDDDFVFTKSELKIPVKCIYSIDFINF